MGDVCPPVVTGHTLVGRADLQPRCDFCRYTGVPCSQPYCQSGSAATAAHVLVCGAAHPLSKEGVALERPESWLGLPLGVVGSCVCGSCFGGMLILTKPACWVWQICFRGAISRAGRSTGECQDRVSGVSKIDGECQN